MNARSVELVSLFFYPTAAKSNKQNQKCDKIQYFKISTIGHTFIFLRECKIEAFFFLVHGCVNHTDQSKNK